MVLFHIDITGDDEILYYGSEMLAGRSSTSDWLDGESGNDSIEFHNQALIKGCLLSTTAATASGSPKWRPFLTSTSQSSLWRTQRWARTATIWNQRRLRKSSSP